MKKITLLLMFMSTFWTYSQVSSYSFAQSSGTYTEIAGTTLGDESTSGRRFVDPAVPLGSTSIKKGPGFDIGFNFTFNGLVYNRFGVSSNGWISLGQSTLHDGSAIAVDMTSDSTQSPLDTKGASDGTMPEDLVARISALASGLQAQEGAFLTYETIGTAPNRVLVVQWKNYKSATGDSFNFQIRLSETTNVVRVVYGAFSGTAINGKFQVGLRAAPLTLASNFVNRTSTTGWGATVQGLSASDTVSMTNLLTPASGLTFSWTPPTCGGATGLVASAIGTNGTTLTWNSNLPAPTSGYEYIVSATMDFPTVSGTATDNTTATVASLNPNTVYYVFLRSNCGAVYTPWSYAGTFKTKCADATSFVENFDSYAVGGTWPASAILPSCWESAGTAEVNIMGTFPVSAVRTLYMRSSTSTVSYAILPAVSNLGAATHRLKFKATANNNDKLLDIGYFTTPGDVSTFTKLETKTINAPTASGLPVEYIIKPGALPSGVKNLVFKNASLSGNVFMYIDDVIWEPIPPCNDITDLVRGYALDNSITFNWAKSASNESAWQYVYGPVTTTDPTTLTPINVSVNPTATTASVLQPSTSYNVWVRSKCSDTELGAWIGPLVMTTTCAPVATISENFDSYASGSTIFPTCWVNPGTTEVSVSSTNAVSGSRSLLMRAPAADNSFVLLPLVNNVNGNNRLRFKATTNTAGKVLEVGYFNELNVFTSLLTKTLDVAVVAGSGMVPVEYYVTPPALPGARLAFKSGPTTGSIYIDDVIWEPLPTCLEVTGLVKGNALSNAVTFSWTKSASAEDAWQYVCGPVTTTNPDSLTPVDVSGSPTATTAAVLQPATNYKIWVRSKCHSASGLWIGPLTMQTSCVSATQLVENFDASTTLPACWTKMGTTGIVSVIADPRAPSAANVLSLSGTAVTNMANVVLPPLGNASAGSHRLRFKARASVIGAKMDMGYFTDMSDLNSYVYIQTVTITSDVKFDNYIVSFGSDLKSIYLALRNPGVPFSSIYLDEVVWEPIPTCADITNLASSAVSNTAATIGWTPGASQSAWQYVLGSSTTKDPSALTPVNVLVDPEVTITGLSPVTSYKVWVRSKCTSTFGAWFGPVVFSTSCASDTAISQNFDASAAFPSCWTKVGGAGVASVATTAAFSSPNALTLTSNNVGASIVAMTPVSNAGEGTHRLRFKVKAGTANTKLEVGYLTNFADPDSFAPLYTYTATQNTSFENKVVELGIEPTTDYLAFRVPGPGTVSFYIDDVLWEPIPQCADVSNLLITGVTGTTGSVAWTKGASETAWQYVKGDVAITNPNSLTPVNVSVSPKTTIADLTPSTSYKVWIRSNCGSGKLGAWSDPITLKTTCVGVTEFAEKFDAGTTFPDCWTQTVNRASVTVEGATGAPSLPNRLRLFPFYPDSWLVVGLKPVSNAGAGTHRLSFKCITDRPGAKLEVGYLKNPSDVSTFELMSTVTVKADLNITSAYETIRINDIGGKPDVNQVLAFRMPAETIGNRSIYIDDLVWEPLPSCADVSQIKVSLPTANVPTVEWSSAGSETQWQVSARPSTETAPDALTALTVNETKFVELSTLNSSSTYKVWVRSVCGAEYGEWVGPVILVTPCPAATALNENFNSAPNYPELPVCWSKILRNAYPNSFVSVSGGYDPTTAPYSVTLNGVYTASTGDVILVSPRLSNLSSGTLKFVAGGSVAVEVGTLSNSTDSSIFTKIQEVALKDESNTSATVNFSASTTDEYIGIRLKTVNDAQGNQYASIDNVTWVGNTLSNDQFDIAQFSYYPNPVKDVLNISYINNISGVTVYNLLGQEVATKTVNENFAKVDMSSLTRGTYMVKVTSGNQIKMIKVVKE